MSFHRALLAAPLLAMLASPPVAAQSGSSTGTTRPPFGCFKVTAAELNIRDKAFASGAVVATARKGDILVKAKRYCTLRGYWCAVRAGAIEGFADKSFLEVAPCPAGLSVPAKS